MTPKDIVLRKFQLMNEELNWLRHFFNEASCGMGPADIDIYSMIAHNYVREGGKLPQAYQYLIGEEDDD